MILRKGLCVVCHSVLLIRSLLLSNRPLTVRILTVRVTRGTTHRVDVHVELIGDYLATSFTEIHHGP